MRIIVILCFLLVFASCNSQQQELEKEKAVQLSSEIQLKYAEGFTIKKFENYKIITINEAWKNAGDTYKYVLYQNEKPTDVKGATFIKVPIESIACMSLTHVAFLEKLGVENSIVGISGCDYVNSAKVNIRIDNGDIKEIGQEQSVNYEVLVENTPDFVMAYGINSSSNGNLNKMKELGLEVVLNSEYMETHPLGKAEWIKFVAAFFNKNESADSIFNEIEQEYLNLVKLTSGIKVKPTVFTGMPWSGAWYVPGAKSFQAQLFKDAGAEYLWLDNNEKSSLVKSKEIIIDEAFDADFWLNQNSYKDINAITDFDEIFKGFSAVKKRQLYNNDNKVNNKGGNDYWESGVANPHLVLRDLIEIFHPNLLEHKFYYYRKLE
jgi:iron complex transport system substrate-binding protein